MPLLVLNPAVPISGALTAVTSGLSIYPSLYKQDPNPAGSPAYDYWSQVDANAVGEAITDIVNSGTVVLFSASAAATASISAITGTIGAIVAMSAVMSSNLNASASRFTATSGVIGLWSGSAAYAGLTASNWATISSGSISSTLAYVWRQASGSVASINSHESRISNLEGPATGTILSATIWGDGTGIWVSGVSGAFAALSGDYYGPHTSGVMAAVGAIGQMFVGVSDMAQLASGTGGSTGTHPTATFYNLREGYYALTASYNALSSTLNTSASKWNVVSSSYALLSGDFVSISSSYWPMSSAFAALSNSAGGTAYLTSAIWNPAGGVSTITGALRLTGTNDAAVVSLQITSSKGVAYVWTGNGTSQFYAFQSGNNISSGSVQLDAEPDFASLALLAVSGYYTTIQVNAAGDYNRMVMMSGTQTAHLMLSQAGLRLSSTFGPFKLNRGLETTGSNLLSGTTTVTGTVLVSGGVNVTGTWASSSHVFENGALNVSGGYDGIHVQVRNNPGSTFFEGWSQGNLVLALSSSGDIATSGALSAALGATMGGSKIVSLGAGTATGDAVEYDQFNNVSASLNSSATLWNNASASISGVVTSASLSVTPSALYIKDSGNKIWKITIDLTGTISTSAA